MQRYLLSVVMEQQKLQAWKGNYISMVSDEVINGKVFTALKYTLALVAMLAMGLQKRGF